MKQLGEFTSTAYGPPWDSMQGTGVTAGGTDLRPAKKAYIVAVDPGVIPLGTKLTIDPNPFGYSGTFLADDTGGAIKGRRIDFYDWRGRRTQTGWGVKKVRVWDAGAGGSSAPASSAASSAAGGELVSEEHRSGALKALVWVLLVLGGAGLAMVGIGRLFGSGRPQEAR